NGVSKSHARTGWRIGYAAGPKEIIQAMTKLASQRTSNPTSIAQYAAVEAHENKTENENTAAQMRATIKDRLDRFYEIMTDIPYITCEKPHGAFYIFPNVKQAADQAGYESVDDWVTALLEEEQVALVPGSGFGAPDNVRLSYATSQEALEEAAKRIRHF